MTTSKFDEYLGDIDPKALMQFLTNYTLTKPQRAELATPKSYVVNGEYEIVFDEKPGRQIGKKLVRLVLEPEQ